MWWVIGLIPPGESIELFLIPASAPQLWGGAYKRSLAANQKD